MEATTLATEHIRTKPMRLTTLELARPLRMLQVQGGRCAQSLTMEHAITFQQDNLPCLARRPVSNVEPFLLLDRLVTNREFKEFMDDGGYSRIQFWQSLMEEKYYPAELRGMERLLLFRDATNRVSPALWSHGTHRPGTEDLPVEGISWYEAAAYASWKGARLPLEAEWEFALREFRHRPAPVVLFSGEPKSRPSALRGPMSTLCLPDSLAEWMADEYHSGDSEIGLVRGGRFNAPAGCINPWFRLAVLRLERSSGVGFRCAAAS